MCSKDDAGADMPFAAGDRRECQLRANHALRTRGMAPAKLVPERRRSQGQGTCRKPDAKRESPALMRPQRTPLLPAM